MLRETIVKNGRLAGIPAADPRITVYKGVPFAAPPVGDRRWRPPQPACDWEGVLNADRFGPISMQPTPGLAEDGPGALYDKEWHVDSKVPMSEDCLYLNVWTPAKSKDEKLPVMFWIFGGGLQVGYPSEMEFDGERFARRGVVFVSVNYRLNVFGFFSHPELTAENPDGPTNLGLLDQLAGLKWVKENISAFGGDPENVTVFGQSAGAGSTMAHLASPMSRDFFHKAIPQSGGGLLRGFSHGHPDLAEAEALGKRFFDFLGVSGLKEAREIDAKTLLNKGLEFPVEEGRRANFNVVLDGVFLTLSPKDAVMKGELNPVPILTGSTAAEFPVIPLTKEAASFPIGLPKIKANDKDFVDFANECFGDDADRYMSLCGYGECDIEEVVSKGTFNRFELGNWVWMKKYTEVSNVPLYLYRFDPPIPGDDAGSFHSSDLWFTFETLAKCWRPFIGKHYDLARLMCNYWTNFAKNGDPNGNDADGSPMPKWEPYTKDAPYAMFLDLEPGMDRSALTELMEFLVEYELAAISE